MAAIPYPACNIYATNVTSTSTDSTWGLIRITGSNYGSNFTSTGVDAGFISSDGKWYSNQISRDRRNNVVWDRKHWTRVAIQTYRGTTINLCSPIVNQKFTRNQPSLTQQNRNKRRLYV